MDLWSAIPQVGIILFGVVGIWLSQSTRAEMRKYSPISGLCGQVFWIWALWGTDQWGMVVVVVLYTITWARGFYNYWIKPVKDTKL